MAELQTLSDFMHKENLARVEVVMVGCTVTMVRSAEPMRAADTTETPEEKEVRLAVEEEQRKSIYERGTTYGGAVPFLERDE